MHSCHSIYCIESRPTQLPPSPTQLPPVCHHLDNIPNGSDEAMLCKDCHLAHSVYWPMMRKFQLKCQPRFDDVGWAKFLNIIRERRPTAAELAEYLSSSHVNYLTKQQALAKVSNKVSALCSHREDVSQYNTAACQHSFTEAQLLKVSDMGRRMREGISFSLAIF